MRVWNVILRAKPMSRAGARAALTRGLRRERAHRDCQIHMASAAAAGCSSAAAWLRAREAFVVLCLALAPEPRWAVAA